MPIPRRSLLLAGAAAGLLAACGGGDDDHAPPNIVATAQATPNLSILVEAVVAAGLVDALSAPGPLTVFAPTNDAFVSLLSELGSGLLSYVVGGKSHSVVVSGGWVEVQPHGTRVLAKTAERPDEIDLKRAQESLDRAERRLKESGEWDIARALRAAERARVRVEAASKKAH